MNKDQLQLKIKHLENEIKLLKQEKREASDKFYKLYNKMEDEVRRRSATIQDQNFELQKEIKKRGQVEKELKETIKEKKSLFKELHLRIKNNLQLISSLLSLQIKDTENDQTKALLTESQKKLRTMALLHDFIYDSGFSKNVNLSEYIKILSKEVYRSCVQHQSLHHLKLNIRPNLIASVKTTLPLGLITNELVTNSMKHAFSPKTKGEIHVRLAADENSFHLLIADNGVGISVDQSACSNKCLGLNLVNLLVKDQLKGKIELDTKEGTQYKILIPKNPKK